MDGKTKLIVGIVTVLIIINTVIFLILSKELRVQKKLVIYYRDNVTELKKRIISDSLNYQFNKIDGTKIIIRYKENEIRKDSIIFVDSDTTNKELIFSKHTKNY